MLLDVDFDCTPLHNIGLVLVFNYATWNQLDPFGACFKLVRAGLGQPLFYG